MEIPLSDRELDAWLHEHLFGWGERCVDGALCQYDLVPDDPHWHSDEHYDGQHARMYSSTGEAMLLVLEAMRARGIMPSLAGTQGMPWSVAMMGGFAEDGEHESLPMAVALAAKNAIEAGRVAVR